MSVTTQIRWDRVNKNVRKYGVAFIILLTIFGFLAGLGVGSFVGRIPMLILIIAEPFCFIDIILLAHLLARALREEVNDENRGSGERQTKSTSI